MDPQAREEEEEEEEEEEDGRSVVYCPLHASPVSLAICVQTVCCGPLGL